VGLHVASDVRQPGHFGFQPVGGLVTADGTSQWDPVSGIPMSMQYAYGTLRGVNSRRYFWPIRGSFRTEARRMHLSVADVGEDFSWASEGEEAYVGPVVHEERDGWMGTWIGDDILYATNGPEFQWKEGDFLDVRGELVGDALQFLVPDEVESLVYTSRVFRAAGTVLGEDVTGLFFHDSMHMPENRNFIRSSYITDLQAAWVAFATEFEDGNIHAGHLVWGTQGFDLMIIERTDGPPIVAHDLEVDVVIEGDYPVEVVYHGRDETWVWTAHGACFRDPIRADLPEGHRRIQGWARRSDETRTPIMTEALMETYNGRLTNVLRGD